MHVNNIYLAYTCIVRICRVISILMSNITKYKHSHIFDTIILMSELKFTKLNYTRCYEHPTGYCFSINAYNTCTEHTLYFDPSLMLEKVGLFYMQYTYIFTQTHTHTHICVCVCVRVCVCVCVCV